MSDDAGRHGTFDDVIAKLPYVRDLGFDVLYFPPIHPIGTRLPQGQEQHPDPGAGRSRQPLCHRLGGGRPRRHPSRARQLRRLRPAGRRRPRSRPGDRPRLRHPVLARPSLDQGSIRSGSTGGRTARSNTPRTRRRSTRTSSTSTSTATPSRRSGTRSATSSCSGREHGVRIFRVDNPHTKPFPFWEWMIAEVQAEHPDVDLPRRGLHPAEGDEAARQGRLHPVLFLLHLAQHQGGADRVSDRADRRPTCRYVMRPNFFVNTPDINPTLPADQRPRRASASGWCSPPSLGGNYGVYSGFELCEAAPVPGKEEYLDSEKYEIKAWDWDRPGNIRDDIALMNRLRREHPALQDFANLAFYNAWNDNILYYGKSTPAKRRLPPLRRQSRPAQRPGRRLRGAAVGVRAAGRGRDRRRGSRHRQPLHLARQDPAHVARPAPESLRHLAAASRSQAGAR